MRYLVCYDLLARGRSYDGLLAAIACLGGRSVMPAVWELEGGGSAAELLAILRRYLAAEDRVLVTAVGNGVGVNVGNGWEGGWRDGEVAADEREETLVMGGRRLSLVAGG